MSKRTVLNETYKGLVESFSIPAELHERDGKRFASFGSAVPIHCCTPDEVSERAAVTHHFVDVFTEQVLTPPDELAFVRLDENTAEKVFINRTKRILLLSSDGALAQWRCAPTFESANQYIAGAPIVNRAGDLVSLVTARRGNHYAVATYECEGGYFSTALGWRTLDIPEGGLVYGDRHFASREQLRAHVSALPPPLVTSQAPAAPLLHRGTHPRIALVDTNGRQLSHTFLHQVAVDNIDYL